MSTPKRHHYLPQFYLEGFCRGEYLFVYDRKENQIRRQTPTNTAVQGHYYTVVDRDGNRNTDIERMLAHIEGATKPIINKVSTKIRLEDGDKETLAMFLAFLMNRVPDFEKSINHVEKHLIKWVMDITWGDEKHAAATLAKFEQDTGNTATITPAQMVEWNRTGAFKINIHRNRSLHLMMALSLSTGNWFKQMEWMFLHAPNKTSFVTSDNPLCLLSPEWHNPKAGYGVGLLTKGAVKVVALNQRTCLLMFDRGDTMSHADGKIEDVRKINHELTVNTDRFLVGRDHALLANLAKRTRLAEWERKGRISIG